MPGTCGSGRILLVSFSLVHDYDAASHLFSHGKTRLSFAGSFVIIVYSKATTVINCTLLSLADFIQKVFLHSDTFEGMSLSQLVLTMLGVRIGSPD